MKELGLVKVWLQADVIFSDGVLLFKAIFGEAHPFLIILKKNNETTRILLHQALCSWYNRNREVQEEDPKQLIIRKLESLRDQPPSPPAEQAPVNKPKIREDFAFLSDPDCPNELKILAADKITAYRNYVAGHKKLFDCTSPLEQFEAAKYVTENFIENRLIQAELNYYKQYRRILGEHPIFARLKRFRELSTLTVVELIKLRSKLQHNIWRIRSEIIKGDKPHLTIEREESNKEKQSEIIEITRLLAKYE